MAGVLSDVVRGDLKCGDLKQGFARVRCPDCHHEYLLAFSCKGRWVQSLVPRLPAPVATPKRLSSSVNWCGKISFFLFLTASTSSVSRLSCANFFSTIANCSRNYVNALHRALLFFLRTVLNRRMASWALFLLSRPLVTMPNGILIFTL